MELYVTCGIVWKLTPRNLLHIQAQKLSELFLYFCLFKDISWDLKLPWMKAYSLMYREECAVATMGQVLLAMLFTHSSG